MFVKDVYWATLVKELLRASILRMDANVLKGMTEDYVTMVNKLLNKFSLVYFNTYVFTTLVSNTC